MGFPNCAKLVSDSEHPQFCIDLHSAVESLTRRLGNPEGGLGRPDGEGCEGFQGGRACAQSEGLFPEQRGSGDESGWDTGRKVFLGVFVIGDWVQNADYGGKVWGFPSCHFPTSCRP